MAILSIGDFQTSWLGGDTTDATARQQILDGLDDAVVRWLGYPPSTSGAYTVSSTTYTQIAGGNPYDGLWDATRVRMEAAPVTAVSEVMIVTDGDFSAGTALTLTTDYVLRSLSTLIDPHVRLTGARISDGAECRVSYTAGYSTIPEGLVSAFGDLAYWYDRLRARRGEASQSSQGAVTRSYRDEQWPPDIKARLAEFKCPRGRA